METSPEGLHGDSIYCSTALKHLVRPFKRASAVYSENHPEIGPPACFWVCIERFRHLRRWYSMCREMDDCCGQMPHRTVRTIKYFRSQNRSSTQSCKYLRPLPGHHGTQSARYHGRGSRCRSSNFTHAAKRRLLLADAADCQSTIHESLSDSKQQQPS